jgi:hypothetical protein
VAFNLPFLAQRINFYQLFRQRLGKAHRVFMIQEVRHQLLLSAFKGRLRCLESSKFYYAILDARLSAHRSAATYAIRFIFREAASSPD